MDIDLQSIIERGGDYFLSNLSIDLVVLGYQEDQLKCLLLKIGDKWMLPGGYIGKEESMEDAVQRTLRDRTRLEKPHFKFLSVFGDKNRRFDQELKTFFEEQGMPWRDDYWINNRFVTLSYYSLVDIDKTHPAPGDFDQAVGWFNVEDLPKMWLDHKDIVNTAHKRLKEDIQREHLTYNLLPEEFTMPQLHQLHQTILGETLDRSRFQKKMLASGIFERLPQVVKETPGRNPYQYRLKE